MRINVVINDDLMDKALALTGLKTKREAVETGLRLLVQLKQQEKIREARGNLRWEGDFEPMEKNLDLSEIDHD